MHTQRARPVTRFLAILAIIITAVVSGGRNVQAFTNPFSLGLVDTLNCSSGSPVLLLSIKNTSGMSVSQYSSQWKMPTLYVAYQKGDGTYYPAQPYPIPNIGPQSEVDMPSIPVLRADTTFTVAIHATDPSGSTVKLLTGTPITPADHCPAPPKLVTTTTPQNPVVQHINNSLNQAALAAYLKDTPTNVTFPKGQACFKLTMAPKLSCVNNSGFGLLVAWGYSNPNAPGVGFRVYRVDNGQHTYMTSVSSTLNVYAAVLPAPKTGDFTGQCFAVVAVRNSIETNLSAPKCATSSDSLHEVVLKTDTGWPYAVHSDIGGGFSGYNGIGESRVSTVAIPFSNNYLSVGYAYDIDKFSAPGQSDDEARLLVRYFAHFNLAPYAGHAIQKAELRVSASESLVKYATAVGNCAKQVAPARAALASHAEIFDDLNPNGSAASPIDPAAFRSLKSAVGSESTADVSTIVEGWVLQPNTNYGLVVRGGYEQNLGAEIQDSCLSRLFPAVLDLQYF